MRILAVLITLFLLTAQAAAQTDGSSLRGTLLVADPQLGGSIFAETVILIIENTPDGSLGVTVNRRTDMTVAEVLPGLYPGRAQDYALYAGGPVEPRRLSVLLRSDEERSGLNRVVPHVAFTANATRFDAILDQGPAPRDIRIIAGITGWGPGQLEDEIANGDWHILPADDSLVFSDAPQDLWERLIGGIHDTRQPLNSL